MTNYVNLATLEGCGLLINRLTLCDTAYRPARNDAHCWKNPRIERSHCNFDYLKETASYSKLASKYAVIEDLPLHMRNAHNRECLCQQGSMCLSTNMCLQAIYVPNNRKIRNT